MTRCASNGWERGSNADYRPDLGLDTAQLFTFIGATQQAEWDTLVTFYGGDQESAQRGFVKQLDKAIANNGLLDVLRKGVKDHGVKIRVAYFKPSLVESESALDLYRANRLTVVKELAYATKQAGAGNRLDLVLFLNGIPVATAELKNPLTGQGVEDAKEQYRTDRDPTELIFTRRVIANFAVDPTMVFVATQLRGPSTPFLPLQHRLQRPRPGRRSRQPARDPGTARTPPPTSGKQVWQRDNWLDLLERFVHISEQKGADGRTRKTVIFPRYPPVARGQAARPRTRPGTAPGTTTWSWRRPAPASPTPSPGSPTGSHPCTPRPGSPTSTRRRSPPASSPAHRSSTRSSSSPTGGTSTRSSATPWAASSRPTAWS